MTKQYTHRLTYTSKPDNRVKLRCHWIVSEAIQSGRLIRQPCERCGVEPAEAHHDDYTKPMSVRWLCRKHHREHHRPTHCKRGHEFTPENTLAHVNGKRRCRTCFNWRAKQYRNELAA